jgi:hypothetical protein
MPINQWMSFLATIVAEPNLISRKYRTSFLLTVFLSDISFGEDRIVHMLT